MQQQSTNKTKRSFFNDFGSESQQSQQQKATKNSADVDWFGDFGKSEPKK